MNCFCYIICVPSAFLVNGYRLTQRVHDMFRWKMSDGREVILVNSLWFYCGHIASLANLPDNKVFVFFPGITCLCR